MRETILEILSGVRSDVDFENNTKLIDDGILESLDIVAIPEFDSKTAKNPLDRLE